MLASPRRAKITTEIITMRMGRRRGWCKRHKREIKKRAGEMQERRRRRRRRGEKDDKEGEARMGRRRGWCKRHKRER